jgi:hypothetical protein
MNEPTPITSLSFRSCVRLLVTSLTAETGRSHPSVVGRLAAIPHDEGRFDAAWLLLHTTTHLLIGDDTDTRLATLPAFAAAGSHGALAAALLRATIDIALDPDDTLSGRQRPHEGFDADLLDLAACGTGRAQYLTRFPAPVAAANALVLLDEIEELFPVEVAQAAEMLVRTGTAVLDRRR